MKLSAQISLSDVTSVKETFFERAVISRLVAAKKRHLMYKIESINTILSSLKKAGVNGMEILIPTLASDKNIQEVQKIMYANSMRIFSIHQSLSSFRNITLKEIERLCSIANIFSAEVIVLHVEALGEKLFNKDFIYTLKMLQKKYHVVFGIENTPKTPFNLFKRYMYKSNEFAKALIASGLFITLDIVHLAQAEGNIKTFYLGNREKIVNIHLSDYKTHWLNKKLLLHSYMHLSLLKGELPIREFLTTLKKTHYNGLITMEINANLKDLCESAEYIRGIIA